MTKLTEKWDWDQNYVTSGNINELKFGWKYRIIELISELIEKLDLNDKDILEIGAGDSKWLPHFAKKYPKSRFAGLDYSRAGCDRLLERTSVICGSQRVSVYCQDMFESPCSLHGRFDVVMSFGVVEHFGELSEALRAKKAFLNRDGLMLSLIPNMAGTVGLLAKAFNREVYNMHNPHNLSSFLSGHREANLEVIESGYLGAVSYAGLAGCFREPKGVRWHTYQFLSRLSSLVWLVEARVGGLPASRTFSPFLYAISRSN